MPLVDARLRRKFRSDHRCFDRRILVELAARIPEHLR
jgi:hypothetical protein